MIQQEYVAVCLDVMSNSFCFVHYGSKDAQQKQTTKH